VTGRDDLQDLYNRFDGVGNSDARLAWYGQERARGLTHQQAVDATFKRYESWCREFWPKRGIDLPA